MEGVILHSRADMHPKLADGNGTPAGALLRLRPTSSRREEVDKNLLWGSCFCIWERRLPPSSHEAGGTKQEIAEAEDGKASAEAVTLERRMESRRLCVLCNLTMRTFGGRGYSENGKAMAVLRRTKMEGGAEKGEIWRRESQDMER